MAIMTGKCPGCKQVPQQVIVQEIIAQTELIGGNKFIALNYQCQYCQTILGVQLNPWLLTDDIVAGVVAMLKAR
jgi:hypothetical protein